MKYKLLTAGILAGSLISYSSDTFADTHKFPDVPDWAKMSVNYLVEKGSLHGKPDGTFAPSETIDRGSAAKILATVLGLEINKNAKPSFRDTQNHWATPYIAAVEKAGVIKGDGNGNFRPTGIIDRASMASMLVNAYKLDKQSNRNNITIFEDIKGHWGEKYANILIQTGISKGTDNGWAPNKAVTRAEAAQFIAKADMKPQSLEEKTIIIDPGHGGEDPGKATKGLPESKIVLDTSIRLKKLLAQHTPFTVLLTRESDSSRPGHDQLSSLQERVAFAKQNEGDIFISIHANAFNGKASGTETYYYDSSKDTGSKQNNPNVKDSHVLAEKIQKRLVAALQTRDRDVKDGDLHVIRENSMPAVLAELAFIDNNIDYNKLSTDSGRQIAAEAIYAGILDYYNWKGFDVSKYRLAK